MDPLLGLRPGDHFSLQALHSSGRAELGSAYFSMTINDSSDDDRYWHSMGSKTVDRRIVSRNSWDESDHDDEVYIPLGQTNEDETTSSGNDSETNHDDDITQLPLDEYLSMSTRNEKNLHDADTGCGKNNEQYGETKFTSEWSMEKELKSEFHFQHADTTLVHGQKMDDAFRTTDEEEISLDEPKVVGRNDWRDAKRFMACLQHTHLSQPERRALERGHQLIGPPIDHPISQKDQWKRYGYK